MKSMNKKSVALICLFFGFIGAHRFYVGKTKSGLLWMLTGGLLGIGIIVDLIRILSGKFKDANGDVITKEERNLETVSKDDKLKSSISIIYLGVLTLGFLIMCIDVPNTILLNRAFRQLLYTLPIILASVIAFKTYGVDFSVIGMSTLATGLVLWGVQRTESIFAGLIAILVIAIFVGIINGVLIKHIKIPSVIVTIITNGILLTIFYMLGFFDYTMARKPLSPITLYLCLAIALGIIVIYVLNKKRRIKKGKIEKPILTCIIVTVLAALGGIASMAETEINSMSFVAIINFYPVILLTLAFISSSKLFEKDVTALIVALLPVITLSLIKVAIQSNMRGNFASISAYIDYYSYYIALSMLVLSYALGRKGFPQLCGLSKDDISV